LADVSLTRRRVLRLVTATLMLSGLAACGGDAPTSAPSDPVVAAQVQSLLPAEESEQVGVFVALGDPLPVAATRASPGEPPAVDPAARRVLQRNFLDQLERAAAQPLIAPAADASAARCDAASLAARIAQAVTPRSGSAVRIDLTACELRLLPGIPSVRGVYRDVELISQARQDAQTFQSAVLASFDGRSAWPLAAGGRLQGEGTVVAVLDTGVEARHPALAAGAGAARVLPGVCFSTANNDGRSLCPNGRSIDLESDLAGAACGGRLDRDRARTVGCEHGTAMAAAAAMAYGESPVLGGVAPAASILPVQVFSLSARGGLVAQGGDLLRALEWLTDEAVRRRSAGLTPIAVANLSLGGGLHGEICDADYLGSLFKSAVQSLRAAGVSVVASAGNAGSREAIAFPACVSNTLSVAAARFDYAGLASYSNFSPLVDVVAIGGERWQSYRLPVLCPATTGGFDCWAPVAGTSPAAALASGALAVLRAAAPTASIDALETALLDAGRGVVSGTSFGDKPVLRLTPAASALLGVAPVAVPDVDSSPQSASSGSASGSGAGTAAGAAGTGPGAGQGSTGAGTVPVPAPAPVAEAAPATVIKVCVHSRPGYTGRTACAQVSGDDSGYDRVFSHWGPVESVSIRDALTDEPVRSAVAVTLYDSLLWRRQGIRLTEDTGRIASRLPGFNWVLSLRIEVL
jgi:predicted small lipoprotein YifL